MLIWPEWWSWELEVSSHIERRMEDRDFTEIELREMMETASRITRSSIEGRWLVKTRHGSHHWEIVVEPDPFRRLLVVVTAYPLLR